MFKVDPKGYRSHFSLHDSFTPRRSLKGAALF